jgi:hypothetical protein
VPEEVLQSKGYIFSRARGEGGEEEREYLITLLTDKENIYGGKPKPYEKSGPKAAQLLGTSFSEGLGISLYFIFIIR